jgi:archaellum component FlaF (FlaF/FlaG flagellin family)
MENAIPALVIGALMLIASAFVTHGNLKSYDSLGESLRQMEQRMSERTQSHLTVTDATLDGGLDTLSIGLRNDGQTRLSAFERMDLIVIYETASGEVRKWLPFESGALSADAWTVDSISDDVFEPGLVNPGETALLTVELAEPAAAGSTHRIVIVSEAGAVASAPFTS